MKPAVAQFPLALRLVHWLMAAMVVAMLFIGVGMVSTVSEMRTWLIDLHKPLGILILCLAALRVCLRLTHPAPPLPDDLPIWQKAAAHASHLVLYALMFALPLVGWTMLSAGGYPIALFGSIHLPPIAPGRSDAVRAAAPHAHPARLAALPDDPGASWRRPVPCLDPPRRRVPKHGALALRVPIPRRDW